MRRGKFESAPAQHWIRNIKTKKELDSNWVFAGSLFVKDDATGKEYYQADSGELICVLSLPTAMLDLPIRSYGALEARSFEAFAEHLPPPGTPVTILLKPVLRGQAGPAAGAKPAAKTASGDDLTCRGGERGHRRDSAVAGAGRPGQLFTELAIGRRAV